MMCLSACAKHPVKKLERQAMRYDRQAEREKAASLTDDRYFVPVADAVAAVANDLSQVLDLAEVSAAQVGTDWTYGGSIGVDQAGEYFDQTRSRMTVNIGSFGPEVQVHKAVVDGQRRIGVKGKPGAWSDSSSAVDAASLRQSLSALEVQHLSAAKAQTTTASVLADFEAALPSGYSVSERSETGLVATAVRTTRKEKERKGLWATWEARTTLTATVNPEGGSISVGEHRDHRFSTEAGEGSWLPVGANQAAATDWLAATLRVGMPAGHQAFGPPLVTAVEPRAGIFTAPPTAPRLRNMDEIAVAVTARAYETGTGNFTVCLNTVLVNPSDDSGYDWDLPGVSDTLAVASVAADAVGGALGEVNAVADQQPMVGYIVDGAFAWASEGTIDRQQAEAIALATGAVVGWANSSLPYAPDVAGTASIGGSAFNLPQTENSLRMDPGACGTTDFRGQKTTALEVNLWDVDLYYNDPIGVCAVSFGTVANKGVSGVPCGWARLYVSVTHNFSFDQIAIVGLPPAQ